MNRYLPTTDLHLPSVHHSLVPLSSKGYGLPLFCIHPSGGDIGIYRKLARHLRPIRPVIAVQSRAELGAPDKLQTIEAMAARYSQLIVQRQPTGPIQLLGFSFGGFVATEIANQLRGYGRQVSFLGLIDSDLRWAGDSDSTRSELKLRLTQLSFKFQAVGLLNSLPLTKVETDVEEIVDKCLGSDAFLPMELLQDLQSRSYITCQDSNAKALCNFISSFMAHGKLLRRFRAKPVEAPMNMWWPSQPKLETDNRGGSWQLHAKHKIVEHSLEGDHYSIMRMPAVRMLAAQVDNLLTKTLHDDTV